MRAKYELADILRKYGKYYREKHKIPYHHHKVFNAIERCRTSALGGHIEKCGDETCGYVKISYNSCRNRHCPKCQGVQRDKWIEARKADLLDCKYYHVVFTLPEVLNSFCMHYPKELYDMLFLSSIETLQVFGRDEKHLGAEVGAISILHTWGQNLSLHPHVHMIVPAGGITKEGKWKHSKQEGKYLFPVRAMSKVYRGKFMEKFRRFMENSGMEISGELHKKLYSKDWVVYAKRPFGGAEQVIEYLGRYTHKIAISNHRIKAIANGEISFSYKDYKDSGKTKEMSLPAEEFIRRFSLHILPKRYRKIRHYGILSSRNKQKLREQQSKMDLPIKKEKWSYQLKYQKSEISPNLCPCCKKAEMKTIKNFFANGPPLQYLLKKLPEITEVF